jgi:hypothetical protein
LFSDILHFPAALSAHPASQKPPAQPIDEYQHLLGGLFHLRHGVGFQA